MPGPDQIAALQYPNMPWRVSVAGNLTTYMGNPYDDPNQFSVNVPGVSERISQPLYSYQLYPAAGTGVMTFFQSAAGQAGVTLQQTNMQLPGQLPAGQIALITGISVDYLPGTTTGLPITGPRADAATGAANDFYTIMRSGVVRLEIGSKPYFTNAPLLANPPRSHMDASLALATNLTTGAATQTIGQVPWAAGEVFRVQPMKLTNNQNFQVTITFPDGVIATPSTDALAKIGVVLDCILWRPAQ